MKLSKNRRRTVLKRCFLAVLLIPTFLYINIQYNWPVMHVFRNKNIKSPCMLPKFDPYDSSIEHFFWHPDPFVCGSWLDLVYVDSDGILRVNETAVHKSGLEGVKCGHRALSVIKDKILEYAPEFTFNLPSHVPSEFFRVNCRDKNEQLVYDYIHYNINWRNRSNQRSMEEESSEQLSVHVFGIDSVSRLLADRKLTRTMKYMREDLGAYFLDGYTKVADNSYPNLVAFLSGLKAYTKEASYGLDNFPLIWKNFSKKGYATLYSEDVIKYATFVGFDKKPVDHYLLPYFKAMDQLTPEVTSKLHNALLFLDHHKIHLNPNSISPLCYGNTPKHIRQIQYLKEFAAHYGKKRQFSFSWFNEIGHDFINFVELVDQDVLNFVKWMNDSGKLQNAVLILFSDHGPRYSEIQNTAIGRVTDLMPLLGIYLPRHIKEKYPHIDENLKTNIKRLTTHYDMYETLKDILHSNFDKQEPIAEADKLPKRISLFNEVPERRSCFDADIPESYCPCYTHRTLSVTEDKIQKIAAFVNEKLIETLKDYSKCATLRLTNINTAIEVLSNFQRAPEAEEYFSFRSLLYRNVKENSRYMVVIETEPCGGLFEATVEIKEDNSMKLLDSISRINKYGNQSSCIEDKTKRLYCCCT